MATIKKKIKKSNERKNHAFFVSFCEYKYCLKYDLFCGKKIFPNVKEKCEFF